MKKIIICCIAISVVLLGLAIMDRESIRAYLVTNDEVKNRGEKLTQSIISVFVGNDFEEDSMGMRTSKLVSNLGLVEEYPSPVKAEILETNILIPNSRIQKTSNTTFDVNINNIVYITTLESLYISSSKMFSSNSIYEVAILDNNNKVISSNQDLRLEGAGALFTVTRYYFWGIQLNANTQYRIRFKEFSKKEYVLQDISEYTFVLK